MLFVRLVTAALILVIGLTVTSESTRSAVPYRGLAAAPHHCTRFASPRGSDRTRGTHRRPFRTVKRLTRSLRRGQTGCLFRGRYRHRGVAEIRRPGVTLRSVHGARARVDGTIWIDPSAVGARVAGLFLTTSDPLFSIPLKVQADRAVVTGNVITGRANTICLVVGSEHAARDVLVERNRITRCGRTDKYDHLIYLVHSRGAVVRWNVLSDNPGGWAVHLYPDADGTLVEHNVIDRNEGGVIFAGDGGDTSDDNVVRNNAITFSGPRWNLEGSWSDGPVGSGNVAEDNCLYSAGPSAPSGIAVLDGFAETRNVVLGRSPYGARQGAGHRFAADSPCARLVGNVAGPPVPVPSRHR